MWEFQVLPLTVVWWRSMCSVYARLKPVSTSFLLMCLKNALMLKIFFMFRYRSELRLVRLKTSEGGVYTFQASNGDTSVNHTFTVFVISKWRHWFFFLKVFCSLKPVNYIPLHLTCGNRFHRPFSWFEMRSFSLVHLIVLIPLWGSIFIFCLNLYFNSVVTEVSLIFSTGMTSLKLHWKTIAGQKV